MKVADLIEKLNNLDIRLSVLDDKLIINAIKGSLTEDILSKVRNQKQEIIKFLNYKENNRSYQSIPVAYLKQYYSMSSAQKRLFTLQQIDNNNIAYNTQIVFPIISSDIILIENIFNRLIEHHESLRTIFELLDNQPVQRILLNGKIKIEHHKIRLEDFPRIRGNFIRPFQLNKGPLIRVGYVELTDQAQNYILVDMHHIIIDDISRSILAKDFNLLFDKKELPNYQVQYKDYCEWINSSQQIATRSEQSKYWLGIFNSEITKINLPVDYLRPSVKLFDGANVSFNLSNSQNLLLSKIAREAKTTLFNVIFSVYLIFLAKISNQKDIVVGIPVSNRNHPDLAEIVGLFLNTLAIRIEINQEQSFLELVRLVESTTLSAIDNQEFPFEDLVETVVKDRDLSRNPIFDVMFNHLNDENIVHNEEIIDKPVHFEGISKFDLTLTTIQKGNCISCTMNYYTKIFSQSTIERFIGYFKKIIDQLETNVIILDIAIISDQERSKLIYEFNKSDKKYRDDLAIQQIFEKLVRKMPLSKSVVNNNDYISYDQLNKKSNQLAHFLQKKNIGRGAIVCLLLKPSIHTVVCILAVIKSGAAFLPIDASFPVDRIRYIYEESESKLILTNIDFFSKTLFEFNIVNLIDISKTIERFPNKDLACVNTPEDPLYIIYTSGSSGRPKGVIINHKNLNNYVSWINSKFNIKKSKTVFVTSYAYDLGYTSLFSAILNGSELHMLPIDDNFSPPSFLKYIAINEINYLKLTPSLYTVLINDPNIALALSKLKLIFLGGEIINTHPILLSLEINPKLKFINHYGPTETTIGCVTKCIDINNIHTFKNDPVIGKPISNTKIYILDPELRLLPIGVYGELCISGDGLSKGYLRNESLTTRKFTDNPFELGNKLYKSGDLACRTINGDIKFGGRIDRQLKLKGYRIEPGEIEKNILSYKKVIFECFVTVIDYPFESLCAYVATNDEIDKDGLRLHLMTMLPSYMIPNHIILLSKIPLNNNGKINTTRLPLPIIPNDSGDENTENEIEEGLIQIWSKILGVTPENIGRNSNYFSLGGNSLKSIIIISEIYQTFNVETSIRDIFSFTTIKTLAERIIDLIDQNTQSLLKEMEKLSLEEFKLLFKGDDDR